MPEMIEETGPACGIGARGTPDRARRIQVLAHPGKADWLLRSEKRVGDNVGPGEIALGFVVQKNGQYWDTGTQGNLESAEMKTFV